MGLRDLPQKRNARNNGQTGRGAAFAMFVLLLLMASAFTVVWVVPSPVQAPLQQAVNNAAQSVNGAGQQIAQGIGSLASGGGGSGTSMSGQVVVTDTTGSQSIITGVPNPLSGFAFITAPSGATVFDSSKSTSGNIILQSLLTISPSKTGFTSWTISGAMVIYLDGNQLVSDPINQHGGSIPPTNLVVVSQSYTGQQVSSLIFPNGVPASVQTASHTMTAMVQGTLTAMYSDGTSKTTNFNFQVINTNLSVGQGTTTTSTTTTTSGGGGGGGQTTTMTSSTSTTSTTSTTSAPNSFTITLTGSTSSNPGG